VPLSRAEYSRHHCDMPDRAKAVRRIREAEETRRLVRVARMIRGADRLDGFVVAIGPKWIVLHTLDHGMFLNGYSAIRLGDIKRVKVEADDSFPAKALRVRAEERLVPEGVDLGSTQSVISTAAGLFGLVTLNYEKDDPTVCFIGAVKKVSDKSVRLFEITPDAAWHEDTTKWPLNNITRIDFGGRYEDALLAVGGEPPAGT
jgi:hypothetical protein